MVQNYYKILGVSTEASFKEIRKAYYTLALKHHPDKNPDDQSLNQRFAEINNAYQTLKDPTTRAAYDRQYNDTTEEFETLIEIIIYVSNCGIAYIKSEMKKLMFETKKLVVNVSKTLASSMRDKALEQSAKLKDQGADLLDKLTKKVGEKYQGVKEMGVNMLDQAAHKAHEQYETFKDKGVKKLGNWKHSVQEKFKDIIGGFSSDSKAKSSEGKDSVINEELHSNQDTIHDVDS